MKITAFCSVLLFGLALQTLSAQAPAGFRRPANVPANYVITPSGYFHPSCVRQLEEGDVLADGVLQHADGNLENIPACEYPRYTSRGEVVQPGAQPPAIGHSWIEDYNVTTSSSYGEIEALWAVPPAPTANNGQTVYFFPGLEDINDVVSIIQPVLGWNAFSGLPAWSIASWNCCVSGNTWHSSPVAVNAGDTIAGIVRSTCGSGVLSCSTWNITTTDENSLKSTTLGNSPNDGQTFNWAFAGALEVYNIANCNDYPANGVINFYQIALFDYNFNKISNPAWSFGNYYSGLTPQCNYGGTEAAAAVQLFSPSCSLVEPASPLQDMIRYFDVSTLDHFYTANFGELGCGEDGYVMEEIAFEISSVQESGEVPLYRYRNSTLHVHFYTTNFSELGNGKDGYVLEEISGYVYPTQHSGTVPLYRYRRVSGGQHFYTTDPNEVAGNPNWVFEEIQCYVIPTT